MIKSIKNKVSSETQIIGNNVLELMKQNNISESQLAKALDVSIMTVRRVISGETTDPRISTLSAIANYFKINVDDLLKDNIMPIHLIKKSRSSFVPILQWIDLEKISFSENDFPDFSDWKNWYPINSGHYIQVDHNSFALESKASLQPKYPKGTLLIISTSEKPLDGDVLLICSKSDHSLSLRELNIDSPKWILQPIISGSELLFYNEREHDIIGVVVLTIFNTRK